MFRSFLWVILVVVARNLTRVHYTALVYNATVGQDILKQNSVWYV